MEIAFALTLGVMTACGVYLLLRARVVPVVLGLTLLSYAVNLFIFSMGRLGAEGPAILKAGTQYADPVPQALVLTAIVISFAMTAFVLVLALRNMKAFGTDHIDSKEPKA